MCNKLSLSSLQILPWSLQHELLNVLIISTAMCPCAQCFDTPPVVNVPQSLAPLKARECACAGAVLLILTANKGRLTQSGAHTHCSTGERAQMHTLHMHSHVHACSLFLFISFSSLSFPSGSCLILLLFLSKILSFSFFCSQCFILHLPASSPPCPLLLAFMCRLVHNPFYLQCLYLFAKPIEVLEIVSKAQRLPHTPTTITLSLPEQGATTASVP